MTLNDCSSQHFAVKWRSFKIEIDVSRENGGEKNQICAINFSFYFVDIKKYIEYYILYQNFHLTVRLLKNKFLVTNKQCKIIEIIDEIILGAISTETYFLLPHILKRKFLLLYCSSITYNSNKIKPMSEKICFQICLRKLSSY